MISNRANLDNTHQKLPYLPLAILFFIFSLAGVFVLGRFNKPNSVDVSLSTPTSIPTFIPTAVEPSPIPEITIALSPSASPSVVISPTAVSTPASAINPTETIKPDLEATSAINLTPTPTFFILTSKSNKFNVPYRSYRQLYQDKELSGDRYTLYYTKGNLAIHIGSGWSWSTPSRQFSDGFKVSGQNTYVYEIDSQKIVDFEYSGLKYTIQCVHNGIQSLKDECNRFLGDFKLL